MKKALSFLMYFCSIYLFAQAPALEWQKLIGGSNQDNGSLVSIGQDGIILIGSYSNSNISGDKSQNSRGSYDYWLVKANPTGSVLWDKTMGAGPVTLFGPENDILSSVTQTSDDSILVGGLSESSISGEKTEVSRGDYDYWLLKLNPSGAILWDKTIGGDAYDGLSDFFETNDGNYIVAGFTLSSISGEKSEASRGLFDIWILKLDTINNIIWQKTIGGSGVDGLNKVIQTTDDGFVLGSTSNSPISGEKTESSFGGNDYWIVKLNSSGVIEWQKTIGGNSNEALTDIIQTVDGGYLVAGYSDSNTSGLKSENSRGGYDFWVVKLDVNGTIQWEKTIGGNDEDKLNAITQCSDSGYILTGSSKSNISGEKTEISNGSADGWIVKLNADGAIEWQKNLGGSLDDGFTYVKQMYDGSFVFTGFSFSSNSFDITETNHGGNDIWLVKLNAEDLHSYQFDAFQDAVFFPNPTNSTITIDLNMIRENVNVTVSSVLGQVISQYNYTNQNRIDLELPNASGVYLVTLESESKNRRVFKVIKQ